MAKILDRQRIISKIIATSDTHSPQSCSAYAPSVRMVSCSNIADRAHSLNYIDSNAYRIDKNHLWRVVAEFAEIYLKCGALIEDEKVRQKSERRISFP